METMGAMVLVWAFICYKMAEKRNRNPLLGAVSGALFGIFSVIYYAMAGTKEIK
jgi:hypothetical protein